ncbi:MAG: spore coat protein CotJB [Oscillospiraceae bacterium]|nr:spore coat protein CotJB [Oscillospiraceae bacterium]
MDNKARNDVLFGSLPSRAALASAYVPMQESVEPNYPPQTAIARGTLFPGLDLPFRGMVNRPLPATPLGDLMAIDFVADELSIYLDTHREDGEAFGMYQSVLALSKEAHKRYNELCGPIVKNDMLGMKSYAWLSEPWPWELKKAGED